MSKDSILDAVAKHYGEDDPVPVHLLWRKRNDERPRAKGTVNIPEGVSIITGLSRKRAAVQVERTNDVCRIVIVGPTFRPRHEARGVLLEQDTRQRYVEHIERHGYARSTSTCVIGDWLFHGDSSFLRSEVSTYPNLGEIIDFLNTTKTKGEQT